MSKDDKSEHKYLVNLSSLLSHLVLMGLFSVGHKVNAKSHDLCNFGEQDGRKQF